MNEISIHKLLQLSNPNIIDIRDKYSYNMGNLKGSINIPYYSLPWEFEADRLGNVEGRKYNPAYFYSYMQYRNTVSWATGNKMNYPVGIVA